MYRYVVVASIALFVSFSYASAATSEISCLEEDRGYRLVNTDGTVEPVRLYGLAVKKFSVSSLNGKTNPQLNQLGVTTGDPREWARLFVMLCKQESDCRIARTYPDGSLEKFSSTLPNERSYGPLQFNIGEYGLNSWAMVNSPSCTLDAFIRMAQQGQLFNYFGSMQRPQEVLRRASWFNSTVQPFADALTLVFDPNAPNAAANYRSIAPYFVTPPGLLGNGLHTSSVGLGGFSAMNQFGMFSGFGSQPSLPPQPILPPQPVLPPQPATSGQPGAQPINTTPQGASALLVQPRSPVRGEKVFVSWMSVGMLLNSCTLKVGTETRSTAEEGTLLLTVLQGSYSFVFSCRDATGVLREVTDSITVP